MSPYGLRVSLLATLVLAWPLAPASAAPGLESFVLTASDAVVLDLPELVLAGTVLNTAWSPSGRYILVERADQRLFTNPGRAGASIGLWTAETRQRRELWHGVGVESMDWLPKTDLAFALVDQHPALARPASGPTSPLQLERWFLRLDARRGIARPLLKVSRDAQLIVSPVEARAVIYDASERHLALANSEGVVRDLTRFLPAKLDRSPRWTADGEKLQFMLPGPNPGDRLQWQLLDVATGKVTAGRAKTSSPEPSPAVGFRIRAATAQLREKSTAREIRPLWLESTTITERQLALITADAEDSALSPRADAVLYVSEGAAWVRALHRVDRSAYFAARDSAERTRVASHMKLYGAALEQYALDHQRSYLEPADLSSALSLYLRDPSSLAPLTYVFPGGKLDGGRLPEAILLGYANAPGGKLQLFADGHVSFVPESP